MGENEYINLDKKEKELLITLTESYIKFTTPGPIRTKFDNSIKKISSYTPEKMSQFVSDITKEASEWDIIQKAIAYAGKGVGVVNENTARFTLNKDAIVKKLGGNSKEIKDFEEVCMLRSYKVEKVAINKRRLVDLPVSLIGGGVTGFFGIKGVPFNLAYTSLMYYRSVQSIALYYGYDVKDDPRELEFASSVTIKSLMPYATVKSDGLESVIYKMMVAQNVTTMTQALTKSSFEEMAKRGGSELLYVQTRALANKQAQKALEKAGKQGIEAGIFKRMMEQLGARMSKEAGKKAIPVIGAGIGALLDVTTMNSVLKSANMIYHKRFLFEKDHRIELLKSLKSEEILEAEMFEEVFEAEKE